MINDVDDMGFIAAFFCANGEPCNNELTDYCRNHCEYCRYVPGWEEIQEMVRDDDRRQQKERRKIEDVIKFLKDDIEEQKAHYKTLGSNMKSDALNYSYYRGEMLQCECIAQYNIRIIKMLEECLKSGGADVMDKKE